MTTKHTALAAGVASAIVELRDYQQADVDRIRKAMMAVDDGGGGFRSVLYVLPTGGGKTYTFCYIAQSAARRGNNVLIIQHRKELIRQASLSLGKLNLRHRVVAPPGKVNDIRRAHVKKLGWPMVDQNANCAVASIQTLARRLEWLDEFQPALIIVDEAHHSSAGTWKKILERCPYARVLGVTATPERTDGQPLGDVFETMVVGPAAMELVGMGSLVPIRIFSFPSGDRATEGAGHKGGDLNAQDLEKLLEKKAIVGDAVRNYGEMTPGLPAIVFCPTVKSAYETARQFKAAGWRFEVVEGDMEDDDRDDRIFGLESGKYHGIVTVDVVSEGTDIPRAAVAIMLTATESVIKYMQQAGRVGRPDEETGKECGWLFDHVGNYFRHGAPYDDREWSLTGKMINHSAPADGGRKVLRCDKCYHVHEAYPITGVCGHVSPRFPAGCTHEFRKRQPPKEYRVEGELQEVIETAEQRAARMARQQQGQAKTLEDLVKMGKDVDQANHILRAREEKDELRKLLKQLIQAWSMRTRRGVRERWGYSMADVREMKPKALRQSIVDLWNEWEALDAAMLEAEGHAEFMGVTIR